LIPIDLWLLQIQSIRFQSLNYYQSRLKLGLGLIQSHLLELWNQSPLLVIRILLLAPRQMLKPRLMRWLLHLFLQNL
jgi:hypothetical protein